MTIMTINTPWCRGRESICKWIIGQLNCLATNLINRAHPSIRCGIQGFHWFTATVMNDHSHWATGTSSKIDDTTINANTRNFGRADHRLRESDGGCRSRHRYRGEYNTTIMSRNETQPVPRLHLNTVRLHIKQYKYNVGVRVCDL